MNLEPEKIKQFTQQIKEGELITHAVRDLWPEKNTAKVVRWLKKHFKAYDTYDLIRKLRSKSQTNE